MKIAIMKQDENGTYHAEIKDEFGDIESAITAPTSNDVQKWAYEHNCDNLVLVGIDI